MMTRKKSRSKDKKTDQSVRENLRDRVRLLPVLMLIAIFALVLRGSEILSGIQSRGLAYAVEEVDAEPPPIELAQNDASLPEQSAGNNPDTPDAPDFFAAEEAGAEGNQSSMPEPPDQEWKDAGEFDFEYSEVRADIYKDLVERRELLERRAQELSVREALLEAAERELDQKLRELQAVSDEISALLQQQSQEEQERIASLVRIYEGMKAKDAARIFNTLDIDVLVDVMSRMSERKSAPILAEMTAERARTVTILLAQQKQLPEIPPQ